MPVLKVTINIDLDDIPVTGFPLVRRFETPEGQSFTMQRPTGAAFTALPTGELSTIQALVMQSDRTTAIRLNGVAGEVTINPNGIVAVIDGSLGTAPTLQNNSGATTVVRGLAVGS